MKKVFLLTAACFIVFLFIPWFVLNALGASKGNWADPRLDALATSVAQQPTRLFCENNYAEWRSIENYYDMDVNGYTFVPDPLTPVTLYVAPDICQSLHIALVLGPAEDGPMWFALASHVLVHEAVHQRLHSKDEGLVDCTALSLDPSIWRDFWHIPAKVRVRKHLRVNPFLTRVTVWAHTWHSYLPPAYQGGCK